MKLPLEHFGRSENRVAFGTGRPAWRQARTGAAQAVVGYSWRSDGLLASRSAGSGAFKLTETFGRDAHGSRVVYGTGGNVVSRATTASAFTDARRPGFVYDAAGNRVSRASPNSGTAAFTRTALASCARGGTRSATRPRAERARRRAARRTASRRGARAGCRRGW